MKADKLDSVVNFRVDSLSSVYDVGTELGRGQFAVVRRCKHKDNGNEFAAKCIRKKRTRASKQGLSRELIEREASILLSIDHENIIKLYEIFETKEEVTLVLELMLGGELFEEICEQEYLTEDDACHYTKQVLDAISYIHEKDIVHLDIKPENIVLKEKGSKTIKLVDFGLAQQLVKGQDVKEMMGTPEFVAPEIINYDAIGPYSDMWAIGVMTYILLSGASPFLGDDMQETYQNIIAVDYDFDDEYFANISDQAKDFIQNLLVKRPADRNTAKDCLSHPWILPQTHHGSLIKTTGFKAFLARRRWQPFCLTPLLPPLPEEPAKQSFRKVCIVSRFRMLGRSRASVDLSASEDVEKEMQRSGSPEVYEEEDEPSGSEEKPRSNSVIDWLDLQQASKADHYRGRSSSKDVEMNNFSNKLTVPGQESDIILEAVMDTENARVDQQQEQSNVEEINEGIPRKRTLVSQKTIRTANGDQLSDKIIETPKVVIDRSPRGVTDAALSLNVMADRNENKTNSSVRTPGFVATDNEKSVGEKELEMGKSWKEEAALGQGVTCKESSNVPKVEEGGLGLNQLPSSTLQIRPASEDAGITGSAIEDVQISIVEATSIHHPPEAHEPLEEKDKVNEQSRVEKVNSCLEKVDLRESSQSNHDTGNAKFSVSRIGKSKEGAASNAERERRTGDEDNDGIKEMAPSDEVTLPDAVSSAVKEDGPFNKSEGILTSMRALISKDTGTEVKVNRLQRSTLTLDVRVETTFEVNKTVTVLSSPYVRSAGNSPKDNVRRIYRAATDAGVINKRPKSMHIVRKETGSSGTKGDTSPRALTIRRIDMMSAIPMRFPSQPDLTRGSKTFVCRIYKETPV